MNISYVHTFLNSGTFQTTRLEKGVSTFLRIQVLKKEQRYLLEWTARDHQIAFIIAELFQYLYR